MTPVTIACFMLTLVPEEDPLDRELQSKELARIMASTYPEPLIFLGYVGELYVYKFIRT